MLLANRTVVFLGDSTSLGMATNLACALWKATKGRGLLGHTSRIHDRIPGPMDENEWCLKFADAQIVCWIAAAKCHHIEYDAANSRFCSETGRTRSLGTALSGAAGVLGPRDVVVANAGVHFNIDNAIDQASLLAELEGVCTYMRVSGEAAPLVVWRETGPQTWGNGRFPYHYQQYFHQHMSDFECEAWPDDWLEAAEPWMSEYNPYNIFFESALAKCAGIRQLPVWFPSAQLGLADRSGKPGDCTHYFGPGSAHGLWNTMLLDLLRNHAGTVQRMSERKRVDAGSARLMDAQHPTEHSAAAHRSSSGISERWRDMILFLEQLLEVHGDVKLVGGDVGNDIFWGKQF
jgi:hypothetical protein